MKGLHIIHDCLKNRKELTNEGQGEGKTDEGMIGLYLLWIFLLLPYSAPSTAFSFLEVSCTKAFFNLVLLLG